MEKVKKTYKRELAVVLLVWFAYIVEVKEPQVVQILVWPVFAFAAASFGFDQFSKLREGTFKSSNGGRT